MSVLKGVIWSILMVWCIGASIANGGFAILLVGGIVAVLIKLAMTAKGRR
jgi:hypothetical protein